MNKALFAIMALGIVFSARGDPALAVPESVVSPVLTTPRLSFPTSVPAFATQPGQTAQVNVTCNNTPSDAATINSAIAGSAVGAEVVISGSCLINQTVKLLGDRAYRGLGRTGTILRQAGGANLVALLASDTFLDNTPYTGLPVSVQHLRLDGNRADNNQKGTAGIILRSWLTVVEDVYITGMSGDGLRLTNPSANGTRLQTSQVNGRITGNFIDDSGRYGLSVEDPENAVTDWILNDNWIGRSGMDGIHLENAAGWIIERNHIWDVPHTAIYANRLFGTSLSNNFIEGFGETVQAGTWCGIQATVQGGAASTIMGNRIFNLGGEKTPASVYRYLAVSTNYDTGVISVVGNTIRGSDTGRGIGLYYTSQGNTRLIVTSAGNAVENVHTKQFVGAGVTLSSGL